MRVALYYPWVYLTSGSERLIVELTARSRHDWTIFTNYYDSGHTFPDLKNRKLVELAPISVERTLGATARSALKLIRQKLPLDGFDRLVILCEGLGDLLTFRNSGVPCMCICLTPLRVAFDSAYHARWVANRSVLYKTCLAAGSAAFRFVDRFAWSRYRYTVFISSEARRRALKGGLISGERCEVVHPGLGFEPSEPSNSFQRFFLLPGRIMWTKNIELGIRAFQRFRENRRDYADFRLIIAGAVDRKSRDYFQALQQLAGGDDSICFKISPSDAELSNLYRTCYATLFTAFNEDWGIVPIESMAFGKPVIAVNRGGPTESVEHGVSGFLEEPNPAAFAERMLELAGDFELAAAMGSRAWRRSQLFTWNRFTNRVDHILDRLDEAPFGVPALARASTELRGEQ